jgi:hypothetical protein
MLGVVWTRVGLCVVIAFAASPVLAKPAPSKLVVTLPILEVLDPGGSVSPASVQQALSKVERELAKCGDESKWTGDALVWLITDWHGKVVKTEVAVEKPAVERCLVAGLKRLVIPKAQSRATTIMRLRVSPPPPPPVNPADQLR